MAWETSVNYWHYSYNTWDLVFWLQGIVAIIAGLILILGLLPSISAIGKDLAKVVKWLGGFQTMIGIIAIIL